MSIKRLRVGACAAALVSTPVPAATALTPGDVGALSTSEGGGTSFALN